MTTDPHAQFLPPSDVNFGATCTPGWRGLLRRGSGARRRTRSTRSARPGSVGGLPSPAAADAGAGAAGVESVSAVRRASSGAARAASAAPPTASPSAGAQAGYQWVVQRLSLGYVGRASGPILTIVC